MYVVLSTKVPFEYRMQYHCTSEGVAKEWVGKHQFSSDLILQEAASGFKTALHLQRPVHQTLCLHLLHSFRNITALPPSSYRQH